MLNFLDPKLEPEVKSLSPYQDGYNATNLISPNPEIKKQGFLAYRTIRPPVDININLICSVNLNYIIVNGRNSGQKSTGFELLLKNKSSFSYQSVSKIELEKHEEGVVFYNIRTFKQNEKIPNSYKLVPMKSVLWRLIICCSNIKLRILRTDNIPCIGSVEVWGFISKTCSKDRKMEVLNMYYNSTPSKLSQDETPTVNPPEPPTNEFNIPNEFFDALTFEIMALPMTLPSGNTVDKSTLDKHEQTQEIYCRKPFDPFTGQVYTKTCKPIFNSALKNRINQFLIQHPNHSFTKDIPRTVGRNFKVDPEVNKEPHKRTYDEMTDDTNPINLDNNLDLILNKTMSKIKRFTSAENQIELICCFSCKLMENLYKITCSHLFCRQCLINLTDTCSRCNQLFKKCDIVRYHC